MKQLATEEREGMSTVVRTVTRWVSAFILLYGLQLVAYGHLTPGGGFAGGVMLACAFVLLMLAFGKKRLSEMFPVSAVCELDCVGALCFWSLAVAGMLFGGGVFFKNFLPRGEKFHLWSGGIIPLCNVAIAFKVMGALVLVVVALSVLRVKAGGTDEEFISDIEE